MHIIAAKAVCFREAAQPDFAQYGRQVVENAQVLAQELAEGGLRIVSGGTDNHLMLVDLTPLNLTGRDAELALEQVNIVGNKNAIPYDTQPPRVTSGLRLGSAALTSRGFGPLEMKTVASLILRRLNDTRDEQEGQAVKDEVAELTSRFPVPGIDA